MQDFLMGLLTTEISFTHPRIVQHLPGRPPYWGLSIILFQHVLGSCNHTFQRPFSERGSRSHSGYQRPKQSLSCCSSPWHRLARWPGCALAWQRSGPAAAQWRGFAGAIFLRQLKVWCLFFPPELQQIRHHADAADPAVAPIRWANQPQRGRDQHKRAGARLSHSTI